MGYKVFIDTNIVIDFFQVNRPSYPAADELFTSLGLKTVRGYCSESVFTTTVYVLRKETTHDSIKEILFFLSREVELLSCSPQLLKKAIEKKFTDFEDALLYEIALASEMDYFITSNTKDFKKIQVATLPVLTAAQFNKLIG